MRSLWLFLGSIVLVSCASLRDTTVFYTPLRDRYYPPKEKDVSIPVLAESPEWAKEVIGRFAMVSDRGYPFIYRALIYNARLQGADAVILERLAFDTRTSYNHIPPGWENIRRTSFYERRAKNKKGEWVTSLQPYTNFVPVFRPGRTVTREAQWTEVTAEMVVRRGKKPLSVPQPEQIARP